MDTRRLRYFLAVAEHGTMARAAIAVGMAQPTLSQQIRALEADLGSVLFDRTSRGMEMTSPGRLLRTHALRLVAQWDAAKTAVEEIEGAIRGQVRIGVIHTYNTAFLPTVIELFINRYPQARLLVEEATASEVEQGILNGRYDVGLAFDPPEHSQLAVAPLFDEHLVFVCSRSSRHANRKAIEVRQLSSIPLALLTQAFATRRLLDAATAGRATLDVQIEMNSVEALLELARRNIAPTIIANRSLAARTDLAVLPLTRPAIRRGAALLWDVTRYQTKATRAFLDIARRVLTKIPLPKAAR
jgi:LysR family transcriptional regulator, cyn operon transcriptional activator